MNETNNIENESSKDKPLSPVLSSTREKFLHRKTKKSTKAKLVTQFNIKNEFVEKKLEDFNENSFSLDSNEDFLDKIEEIEKNREEVYKLLQKNKGSKIVSQNVLPIPVSSTIETIKSDPISIDDPDIQDQFKFTQGNSINVSNNSNFQTAAGKLLTISLEKIEEHSKLFNDILGSNVNETKRKNKFNALQKSATVIKFKENNSNDTLAVRNDFIGFSKESLEKSVLYLEVFSKLSGIRAEEYGKRKINNTISESNCKKAKMEINSFKGFNHASGNQEIVSNTNLIKAQTNFDNISKENLGSNSFSTASGKNIAIKDSDLIKAKNVFDNVDFKDVNSSGFTKSEGIALNNQVIVERTNLIKAHTNFENISKENLGFNSFSTASGKNITIKDSDLIKAKNVFNDIEFKDVKSPDFSKIERFDIALDNQVIVEKTNLIKAHTNFENISKENLSFNSFSTASGKNIVIKDSDLIKAKNVFDDIDFKDVKSPGFSKIESFDIALDNQVIVEKTNLIKTQTNFENISKENLGFNSFSTASGKDIIIKDSDLIKAKKVFDHIEFKEVNPGFSKIESENKTSTNLIVKEKLNYFDQLIKENYDISPSKKIENNNTFTSLNKPTQSPQKKDFDKENSFDHDKRDKIDKKPLTCVKDKLKFFDELIGDNETEQVGNVSSNANMQNLESFSSASEKTINTVNVQNNNENQNKITKSVLDVKEKLSSFDKLSGDNCDSLQDRNVIDSKQIHLVEKNIPVNNNIKIDKINNSNNNNTLNNNVNIPVANNINSVPSKISHLSVKDKLKFFDQLIGDDCDFVQKDSNNAFASASMKPVQLLKQNNNIPESKFNTPIKMGHSSVTNNCFARASGKSLQLSDSALKKASSIFSDILDNDLPENKFITPIKINSTNLSTNTRFASASSGKSLQLSDSALKKATNLFGDILDNNSSTPTKLSFSNGPKSKRKLGISTCRQISIPESKLHRARLIFDEELNGISPIKPLAPNCSTPVGNSNGPNLLGTSNCSTPVRTSEPKLPPITIQDLEAKPQFKTDSAFTFIESKDKTLEDNHKDYMNEIESLEKKLALFKCRCQVLEKMKIKPDCDKKPKIGVLYQSKLSNNKITIKEFVKDEKPDHNAVELFNITPKNALDLHFKESSTNIVTSDGATVVPNINNVIGINEIESAFESLPGVDPALLHNKWIKNHYKWIVWKLAKYERIFPSTFQGVLSVEHIIQQLKYRYDREIDKAERPALRKILEKDDIPQKRLVLCVSDIKKVNVNKYELELTDGWYSIRTLIDEPLNQQILLKKLSVGTKLITCGAELMNCDGCHPLDVTEMTYLKINFNSTRRARWDVRLGYQRIPAPFSIPVHSIHPSGGVIASINICIARVYPFRYLDKSGDKPVWRNKKAEERQAQEWENKRYQKVARIEDDIRKEFMAANDTERKIECKKFENVNISNVTCPKTLLEIMENCRDPDSLEASLSSSQKSALFDYKRSIFLKKQQEMQAKVKNSVETLKIAKRDVAAVAKLLLVDLNGSPTRGFYFFLWQPTESHIQMLQEGASFTIYNVVPRANGDLYSTTKTTYKQNKNTDYMSTIFNRKLIEISDLCDSIFSNNFREFDTVGIIISTSIDADSQEQTVWLCDLWERILVIEINESPTTCLLLDTLKRGQIVSVYNLIYNGVTNDVCIASANHFTVFSEYPKYKHLQIGLNKLKGEAPKDLDTLLKNCENRIEAINNKNTDNMSMLEEEDTLTSSRLTSTDIALSLIDVDKFI